VAVGPPSFCASRLGVALGCQLRRLLEPHAGAAGSSPPVIGVPPCRDSCTGQPFLPSVVSTSAGVRGYRRDAPRRDWLGSPRQVGGVRARRGGQARTRRSKGAPALGASANVAGRERRARTALYERIQDAATRVVEAAAVGTASIPLPAIALSWPPLARPWQYGRFLRAISRSTARTRPRLGPASSPRPRQRATAKRSRHGRHQHEPFLSASPLRPEHGRLRHHPARILSQWRRQLR